MEKMKEDLRNIMAAGSIVISGDKGNIVFLEGPLPGDVTCVVERLEGIGYKLVGGIQHAAVINALFEPIHYYSATLRKK